MAYTLNPALKMMVDQGIVTVSVTFTRTGIDSWVRAVQPHPRLGVFPHESMSEDEAVDRLKKAVRGPIPGDNKKGLHGGEKEFDPFPYVDFPIGKAIALVKSRGLDKIERAPGVINSAPIASLTEYDLRLSPENLIYRSIAVAAKIGLAKACGRIASDLDMRIKGADGMHNWWLMADCKQRVSLLSDSKSLNRKFVTGPESLAKAMELVPCPFRGTDDEMAFRFSTHETYTVSEGEEMEEN